MPLKNFEGFLIHIVKDRAQHIVQKLEAADFQIYLIRGSEIMDRNTFFTEFARTLNFPDYFGKNWDAWDECLSDFKDQIVNDKTAIVWEDADKSIQADPQSCLEGVCDLREIALKLHSRKKNLEIFLLGEWNK